MARKLSHSDIPPDTVVLCPNCKTENLMSDQRCKKCAGSLDSARAEALAKLEIVPPKSQQAVRNRPSTGRDSRALADRADRYLGGLIGSVIVCGIAAGLGLIYNNQSQMEFAFVFLVLAFFSFSYRRRLLPGVKKTQGSGVLTMPADEMAQPLSAPYGRRLRGSRRMGVVLTSLGASIVLFGVLTLVGAFATGGSTHARTADIPPQHYVYFHSKNPIANGHLSGSYSITPGNVSFYIFTSDEYKAYSDTGIADSLYSSSYSSGSFSVDIPGAGVYYVVVEHSRDPALQSTSQALTLTYSISGIAVNFVALGVVILVTSAVLIAIGTRMRSNAKSEPVELF